VIFALSLGLVAALLAIEALVLHMARRRRSRALRRAPTDRARVARELRRAERARTRSRAA
jgi:hypothetical protein